MEKISASLMRLCLSFTSYVEEARARRVNRSFRDASKVKTKSGKRRLKDIARGAELDRAVTVTLLTLPVEDLEHLSKMAGKADVSYEDVTRREAVRRTRNLLLKAEAGGRNVRSTLVKHWLPKSTISTAKQLTSAELIDLVVVPLKVTKASLRQHTKDALVELVMAHIAMTADAQVAFLGKWYPIVEKRVNEKAKNRKAAAKTAAVTRKLNKEAEQEYSARLTDMFDKYVRVGAKIDVPGIGQITVAKRKDGYLTAEVTGPKGQAWRLRHNNVIWVLDSLDGAAVFPDTVSGRLWTSRAIMDHEFATMVGANSGGSGSGAGSAAS